MRARTFGFVVVLVLFPVTTYAHGHTWDFFFGGAGGGGSTLGGLRLTADITSKKPANENLALVLDLVNLWGTHEGAKLTRQSYQGGVRWALNGADDNHHVVSVNAQGGVVVKHLGAERENALAFTYGLSYDWAREPDSGWGIRVQVEGVALKSDKDFFQGSIGVVKRF